MRKLWMMAVPMALAAVPAAAQSTGTVAVDGSVAGRCLFTTPSATISVGEMAVQGTGTTAGKLNAAVVNGQTRTLVGWCNGSASTMSVEATPLNLVGFPAAAPTGFDKRVDYTATAVANAVSADDSSIGAGAGDDATVGLFTGDVVVTLSAASSPTNGLLIAGGYQGQVLVTLSPAIGLPLGD
jgi:hypothetical protein